MVKEYSEEDKKEFRAKDLRIARESILKPLIEKLPLEDVLNVQKVTEINEQYIKYVYNGVSNSSVATDAEVINWKTSAENLGLAIPTSQNEKALDSLMQKCMANKVGLNAADILTHVMSNFGRYPTKSESVETIFKSLTN